MVLQQLQDNNLPVINKYLDDYIMLWDIVNDDSIVYVPVLTTDDPKKKKYLLFTEYSDDEELMTHIFISDKEAYTYRRHHKDEGVVFVKMKLTKLYESLDRYFKKYSNKKFTCILSTVDTDGKPRSLIDVWCNINNC